MFLNNKIYGTTFYIDKINIETIYGTFVAHTFQDLITKGYIIAIAHGNIKSEKLYVRYHSSCVTSETLRSLDCDCVKQLKGAFKKISEYGNGIIFYLMQEGRGCGYVGKSRACMCVQHTHNKMTTFDAYDLLGMEKDYRSYQNIKDICEILKIKSKFVLFTNNPDKINGLKNVGIKIDSIESIEIAPNSFNSSYLKSKMESGHILKEKFIENNYGLPPNLVEPFEPYTVPSVKRLTYVSAYYLPIKPINSNIILTIDEYNHLCKLANKNFTKYKLYNENYLVNIPDKKLYNEFTKIFCKPYWFKVNVFYDVVTQLDYVVLEYTPNKNATPIIRIHSESILNRFPLKDKSYGNLYKKSIELIIKNGNGYIFLFYNDGRGSGFGNYILNKINKFEDLGIKDDKRDYLAVAHLIKFFVKNIPIILLYSCKSSMEISKKQLEVLDVKINKFINIGIFNDELGHSIIKNKYENNWRNMKYNFDKNSLNLDYKKIIVYGIGSSEAHAKYLIYLLNTFKNIPIEYSTISNFKCSDKKDTGIIIFSQGISPNINIILSNIDYKNLTLFTSVTESNNDINKVKILQDIKKNGGSIINFPKEDEYETLLRLEGPLCGYLAIINSIYDNLNITNSYLKHYQDLLFVGENTIYCPEEVYVNDIIKNRRVLILCDSNILYYSKNILNKFIEGLFFEFVHVVDYYDFVHGMYQNLEYNRNYNKNTSIIILKSSNDDKIINKIFELLKDNYKIWTISSKFEDKFKIIEFEIVLNYFLTQLCERLDINQISWFGKKNQEIIYSLKIIQ